MSAPSAPRLLVPAIPPPGECVPLPEEEARHARSRRLLAGDGVLLLDGRGGRARGTLGADRRTVRVEEVVPAEAEPLRRVTLVLPAAEPARVEWAVEKGTECGAAAFCIAVCERSQAAHVRVLRARLPRLARIAAEAVKQCGRTCVPEVSGPEPLAALAASLPGPRLTLLYAQPGAARLVPSGLPVALAVAIGPEGGFSPSEAALLSSLGAVAFGLGPRTLRLETAAVASLSLLVEDS